MCGSEVISYKSFNHSKAAHSSPQLKKKLKLGGRVSVHLVYNLVQSFQIGVNISRIVELSGALLKEETS